MPSPAEGKDWVTDENGKTLQMNLSIQRIRKVAKMFDCYAWQWRVAKHAKGKQSIPLSMMRGLIRGSHRREKRLSGGAPAYKDVQNVLFSRSILRILAKAFLRVEFPRGILYNI
jgi:hypothetical protein